MISSSLRASSERPKTLAAARLDLLDQRRELVAVAPPDEDGKAFGRKFLGDLAADKVARADYGRGCISRRHDHLLTNRA